MRHIPVNNNKTVFCSLGGKNMEGMLDILKILKEIHMVFFNI